MNKEETASGFRKMQEEQKAWVLHNFGKRPASQPCRGIVEELGELDVAWEKDDHEEIRDAIADTMIFVLDYCTSMDLDAGHVYLEADQPHGSPGSDISIAGALCHYDLKKEQGIRDVKKEDIESAVIDVVRRLLHYCSIRNHDLLLTTESVWSKVRLRDWKKDSAHAGVNA